VRDAGVIINWYGTPCYCRCRHCLLKSSERLTTVPFERAEAIAEKFVRWRDERDAAELCVEFAGGYSCELPWLARYLEFRARHGTAFSPFVPMNGIRIRSEADTHDLLLMLKDADIMEVGLTFYGTGEMHDRWARRKGDVDYLLSVARAAANSGMQRVETIFLREATLGDLPELLGVLDEIPGLKHRSLGPWDYRGRGKLLEEERIRAPDINRLPDGIKCFVNVERYRSEGEWVSRVSAGDIPAKTQRWYLIAVWEDNVERLESADCGQLIEEMRDADDAFHRSIPPLRELAARYGDPRGDRLYALRDLEWKWTDAYLTEHPEIDATARFDDLTMCVLTR